jgi:hypothetical protein
MYDVVRVAIVDALEDLLHENRGIFLGEFASCDDLVKELSTLAYPNKSVKIYYEEKCLSAAADSIKSARPCRHYGLLCDNVVALLVLEELVHLHDVGVILQRNVS